MKRGPAKNGGTLLEICRVDKVLLDQLEKKCEANLVKRIVKISINGLNDRKRNEITESIGAQNFLEDCFFQDFLIFKKKIKWAGER